MFSVAIPIGMKPIKLKIIFRAAVIFAIFHIVLILAGYHMGHFMGAVVERMGTQQMDCAMIPMENWASIVGALVLIGLGIYMIKENICPDLDKRKDQHPLQGGALFLLAESVSIDALAAGFSMGMMDVDLIRLSLILGAVIFMIGMVGFSVGQRIGRCIGKRAESFGGMMLILWGIHVLGCMWY